MTATILNRENEASALFNKKGLFSDPDLIIGKSIPLEPSCSLHQYIFSHFTNMLLVDFITYRGVLYSTINYHAILLKQGETRTFSVGVIRKILVSHTSEKEGKVVLVYQFSELTPIDTLGLYHVTLLDNFGSISLEQLDHFCPVYLFDNKDDTESLYLSLLSKPYLE